MVEKPPARRYERTEVEESASDARHAVVESVMVSVIRFWQPGDPASFCDDRKEWRVSLADRQASGADHRWKAVASMSLMVNERVA